MKKAKHRLFCSRRGQPKTRDLGQKWKALRIARDQNLRVKPDADH